MVFLERAVLGSPPQLFVLYVQVLSSWTVWSSVIVHRNVHLWVWLSQQSLEHTKVFSELGQNMLQCKAWKAERTSSVRLNLQLFQTKCAGHCVSPETPLFSFIGCFWFLDRSKVPRSKAIDRFWFLSLRYTG